MNGITSLVLLVALGTHSVFEGIALGLTQNLSAVLNIMIALIIHKMAASMSLGISIQKNLGDTPQGKKKGMILMVLFALATPIGILIGILLQETNEIVEIIFSSLAAGSFVYIAASEVIVEEFSVPGARKWL